MSDFAPILTLEPLLEGISEGIRAAGWTLSGLQKTTSHQFEGRWEGESTRSAYLFFHSERHEDDVSIDVFLDETGRGLSGNLALVVELAPLAEVGEVRATFFELARVGSSCLPDQQRTPISLRFRISDSRDPVDGAESQVRFKVRIPQAVVADGASMVQGFGLDVTRAFERILESGGLDPYRLRE